MRHLCLITISIYVLHLLPGTVDGWVTVVGRTPKTTSHSSIRLITIGKKTTTLSTIPLSPSYQYYASSSLSMAIWDSVVDRFLGNREGDFIKLGEEGDVAGDGDEGPLLILYAAPPGIDDDEILDMISDGAPNAFQRGVKIRHILAASFSSDSSSDDGAVVVDPLLTCTAREAIATILSEDTKNIDIPRDGSMQNTVPVLYFSGFQNDEMLATYRIISTEMYQEAGVSAACAKAVPNAMDKSLGQLFDEISGDHIEATKLMSEDASE